MQCYTSMTQIYSSFDGVFRSSGMTIGFSLTFKPGGKIIWIISEASWFDFPWWFMRQPATTTNFYSLEQLPYVAHISRAHSRNLKAVVTTQITCLLACSHHGKSDRQKVCKYECSWLSPPYSCLWNSEVDINKSWWFGITDDALIG
jgi:hypothetical protein